jgi:DNA-binding NarL/FixJ family response regulator
VRPVKILVVDDFEEFRRFVCGLLRPKTEFEVTEVSDGLEAVRKADELQPDLIVLDIALPSLNGLEAARRIREFAPRTKILFLSGESSPDVVREALRLGALGYVHKPELQTDLVPAMEAVFKGELFVSRDLKYNDRRNTPSQHEVGFYSDDRPFLEDVTQFVAAALRAGNAVIVVATESHRNSLVPRLQAQGLDIGALIEQGRYIPVDAADTLSAFMTHGRPDPVQYLKAFDSLILKVTKNTQGKQPRVAVFGETAPLLWAQGNAEAAILTEKLGNQLVRLYDVEIMCGYSLSSGQHGMDDHIYQRICAEHSAVHSR